MITATIDVSSLRPFDRDRAMRLAAKEYDRVLAHVRTLAPGDWRRPTACPDWDVQAMFAHIVGMAEWLTSIREFVHAVRAGKRGPGEFVDALSATQVADRAACTPAEFIARLERAAPKAVRTRRRVPAPIRKLRLTFTAPDGRVEKWPLAHLHDVVLTRDVWMHRLDIARATDREMICTADHDGVLVADVVKDWAHRHGQPFALTLTGPAGGEFASTAGGTTTRETTRATIGPLAATEFCLILSGRGSGSGLLTTEVPF